MCTILQVSCCASCDRSSKQISSSKSSLDFRIQTTGFSVGAGAFLFSRTILGSSKNCLKMQGCSKLLFMGHQDSESTGMDTENKTCVKGTVACCNTPGIPAKESCTSDCTNPASFSRVLVRLESSWSSELSREQKCRRAKALKKNTWLFLSGHTGFGWQICYIKVILICHILLKTVIMIV